MATLPQFKQRQLARRSTSDIDRLAKQYKSNVDALTGEYQAAFTGYQTGVTEKMKPFEAQMASYKETVLPTYEAQRAAYQARLEDYNALLADIEKNPVIARTGTQQVASKNPLKAAFGKKDTITFEYFEPREIPKFEGTAPDLPKAPVAPEIEKFDEGEFGTKRVAAESTFKREVGERRAAKLGAVSRKMTRPLLTKEKA